MKKYCILLASLVIIAGCSWFAKEPDTSKADAVGSSAPRDTGPTAKGGNLNFNTDEYTIVELDTNGDKKTDVFNIFKKIKNAKGEKAEQMFLKKMDLIRDEKIDVYRFYDEKGSISKEELDLDFDGKIDEADYYQNGIVVRKEIDHHFDEKTDIWKFYDEKGILVKLEEDQDGDGNVDYWEFYNQAVITRVEKDTDKDARQIFTRDQASLHLRLLLRMRRLKQSLNQRK